MKTKLYSPTAVAILMMLFGCESSYPDIEAPVGNQSFDYGDTYEAEDASGLSTSATQLGLFPQENAKLYYVDGNTPGADASDIAYSTQYVSHVLDGICKVQNAGNQFQLSMSASNMDNTATTMDIVITIPDGESFDFMKFVNRNYTNGFPYKYEVLLSRRADPDSFSSIGTIVQSTGSNPGNTDDYNAHVSKVEIPSDYIGDVAKAKFRIAFENCYGGKYIACREIEFWNNGTIADVPDCFADPACTTLKDGVTATDINSINSAFYKNMASAIFNGTYEPSRILHVAPVSDPSEEQKEDLTTFKCSNISCATGISAPAGEKFIVFADGITSKVDLVIMTPNKPTASISQTFALNNGINVLDVTGGGLVNLSNLDKSQTDVKINLASGKYNCCYDAASDSKESWDFILANSDKTQNLNMVGESTILTFSATDAESYCSDPSEILKVYDTMVSFQRSFVGSSSKAKVHFYETSGRGNMSFTNGWGEFNPKHAEVMLSPTALLDTLTEFAQITAQVMIPKGFTWAAVNTAPANRYLLAAATEEAMGQTPFFAKDPELYTAAFKHYFIDKSAHSTSTLAALGKTNAVHLWQLHLYAAKVLGDNSFFTNVISELRKSNKNTPDNFALAVCKELKINLIDFFNSWGYKLPASFTDELTSAGITTTPDVAVQYISDNTVSAFRNPKDVTSGSVSIATSSEDGSTTFSFTGCSNAVAYEIYSNGVLAQVSTTDTFTIKNIDSNNCTAKAIAADGKRTDIKIN